MSDTTPFGFGRFVPGFDFLQNLAKGATAGMPAMPALSGWVAPTMSVEEIDKRIQELKAVQFWLEQNARALTATVQALEVQKMTLATLQGMNVAMGDMVGVFGAARTAGGGDKAAWPAAAAPAPEPAPQPEAPAPQPQQAEAPAAPEPEPAPAAPGVVDPMQWWGALTSQFQQLAANALKDAGAHRAAFENTREMASGAIKAATDMAAQMTAQGMQGAAAAVKPKAKAAAPAATPDAKAKPRPAARKTATAAKKKPAAR